MGLLLALVLFLQPALIPGTVDTYYGSFRYAFTDTTIPGLGPVPTFTRTYDSVDAQDGPLGPGWTHTYNVYVFGVDQDIVLARADRRAERYTFAGMTAGGAVTYDPPPGVSYELIRHADLSFTLRDLELDWMEFSAEGRLTAIVDRFGNESDLTYEDGVLVAVRDPAGRGSFAFSHDDVGHITSVTDWIDRTVGFEYDEVGRLWRVTDRAGAQTTFSYDGDTHLLTRIVNPNGHASVTNHYRPDGRIEWHEDAVGNRTTFAYAGRVTTVTLPPSSDGKHPIVELTYDDQGRLITRRTEDLP